MGYPRLELVEPVTQTCERHEHPIWECAGCQSASVVVVQSAMTGERTLRGIGRAVVRPNARIESLDRYRAGKDC